MEKKRGERKNEGGEEKRDERRGKKVAAKDTGRARVGCGLPDREEFSGMEMDKATTVQGIRGGGGGPARITVFSLGLTQW